MVKKKNNRVQKTLRGNREGWGGGKLNAKHTDSFLREEKQRKYTFNEDMKIPDH